MEFKKEKSVDVVGVGNALMDILVEVDESFLIENNLTKGKMHLVSETEANQYLEAIKDKDTREIPGGASANTIRGVAALGGSTAFFGTVGGSLYGGMYRDALESQSIDTYLHEGEQLTGNAITYITPDFERTFTVHLGAACELVIDLIDEEVIKNAKVVHLEAFQFEAGTRSVLEHVIQLAKQHGTLVSLDLNDASLIERNFDLFHQIVREDIDIVFLNETELAAYSPGIKDPSLALSEQNAISVVKVGEDGSMIKAGDTVYEINPVETNVVDTTGAGDLYAAGFLYGLTHGYSMLEAGNLGAKLASNIISRIGVDVSDIDPTILEIGS